MGNQSAERDWTVFLRRVGPLTIGTSIGEVRRIIGDPAASLIQALHQVKNFRVGIAAAVAQVEGCA